MQSLINKPTRYAHLKLQKQYTRRPLVKQIIMSNSSKGLDTILELACNSKGLNNMESWTII